VAAVLFLKIFHKKILGFGILGKPNLRKNFSIVLIVILGFSLYMIGYILYDYYRSYTTINALHQQFDQNEMSGSINSINSEPNAAICNGETGNIIDKFKPLLKVNSDVVGWINIPGTRIDYPVLQSNDNEYYLDHDINGNKSFFGSIFMDFRNNIKKKDSNIILYGHDMKNGSMFHDLVYYKKKDFFESHPLILFETLYKKYKGEIFSVYVTDTKFNYLITNFASPEEYGAYLDTIRNKSLFKNNVTVTTKDRILTLSTCSYEFKDARLVIHAKLIEDTNENINY